jgi:hypothetical protein
MTIAAVPALVTACGDDDNAQPATQPVATQPVASPGATQAPAKSAFLFVDLDNVRGSTNLTAEEKPTQSCVQVNQFQKNEQIVFRIRVFDPSTGTAMDDQALDKVEVKLKDGTVLDAAKYGAHPKDPPNDYFWTTSFTIPATYPSGTLDFTVTATDKEGRKGTFTPLHWPASATLTVLDKVRPLIPQ